MDFERHLVRTRKIVLALLALFLVLLFRDPHSTYILGLIFGTSVSLVNVQLLGSLLKRMSDISINKAILSTRLGYGMRLVLVVISMMLAFKQPKFLNLYTTALGLFVAPAVTTLSFGFSLFKGKSSK